MEIITGLGSLILAIAEEVTRQIEAISTPMAVLIGFYGIFLFLRGWERRLSRQLFALLDPEGFKDQLKADRELKEWERQERRRNRTLGPGDMWFWPGIVISEAGERFRDRFGTASVEQNVIN